MPIRMQRRLPSLADLRPLMGFRAPELNPRRRRLAKALTIADLRRIAIPYPGRGGAHDVSSLDGIESLKLCTGYKIDGRINWRYAFNAHAPVLPGLAKTEGFVL